MRYAIIHELPGRMRVHCRNITRSCDCDIELNRWVSEHSEVVSASLSMRTGNLLLVYAKNATRESILLLLGDLRIFGMATIVPERENGFSEGCKAVANACVRAATGMVIKAFLPKPLRAVRSGFVVTRRVAGIAEKAGNGDVAAVVYGMGKQVFLSLLGAAWPIRLFFAAGFALLEQFFPRFAPARPTAMARRGREPLMLEMVQNAI